MFGLITSVISTAAVMGMMNSPVDYAKPMEPTMAAIVVDAYKHIVGGVFDRLGQIIFKLDRIDKRMDNLTMSSNAPAPATIIVERPARTEAEKIPALKFVKLHDELDPVVAASLARIDHGAYTIEDVASVMVAYKSVKDWGSLAKFCVRMKPAREGWRSDQTLSGFGLWFDKQCSGGDK